MTAATQLTPRAAVETGPACWGVDPELFYGPADSAEGQPVFAWERHALTVCGGCPIRAACLAAALEFPAEEQHGVIGGMTAGQRRVLLRAVRQAPIQSSMTGRAPQRQPRQRRAQLTHLQPEEVA